MNDQLNTVLVEWDIPFLFPFETSFTIYSIQFPFCPQNVVHRDTNKNKKVFIPKKEKEKYNKNQLNYQLS